MASSSLVVKQPTWKEDDMAILCGIANAGGGSLLISANRKDYNTGMRKLRKTFELIPSMTLRDLGITCVTEPVMDGAQLCLAINIPAPEYAVSYFGKYYLYSNGSNQVVSKDTAERALQSFARSSWETQIQPNMKRQDIDRDILTYMSKMADFPDLDSPKSERMVSEILESFNLIDSTTDSITNIGVLLLHKEPQTLIPGALIRIGEFDSSGIPTGKNDIITGPITKQLKTALEILEDEYHVIGHVDADNTTAFIPEKAMHEALTNALVHKDYKNETAININVYPDRVFIMNVGRPPADWTVDTLLGRHSSRPNNPMLATALHKSDLFNGWGNGIEIIQKTCDDMGSCYADFTLNSDETIVHFELGEAADKKALKELNEIGAQVVEYSSTSLEEPTASSSEAQNDAQQESAIDRNISNVPMAPQTSHASFKKVERPSATTKFSERSIAAVNELDLTNTDEYVIKVIETNGRATATRIAEILGVSESTVRRSFRKLREMGLIKRIGSDKAGYWKIDI